MNDPLDPHPHFGFHIHKANQDAIDTGKLSELFAEPTENYASHEEALLYFVRAVNIENAEQQLGINKQLPLFQEVEV